MITPKNKKKINKIVSDLSKQDLTNKKVDKQLYKVLLEDYHEGIVGGLGKALIKTPLYDSLYTNIQEFVACKNYLFIEELRNLDRNDENHEQNCLDLSALHNEIYADVESDMVFSAADSAKNWMQQTKLAKTHYMVYHATDDDKVREDHLERDGVCLEANDDWWLDNYPPIDYNCRCYTTMEEKDDNEITDNPPESDPQPQLAANPGQTGEIFDKDHPYFKDIPENTKNEIYRELK